jgi:hypothetical protein
MLRGIAGEAMPYRDPHTAGPALWALLQSTQCTFEVSCLPVPGSGSWRRGLEAVAIAHYRQQNGRSPAVNFGRMPSGYRMSSANNSRLVAAGKRFQGGPTGETDPSHLPGVAPVNGLDGDVQGPHWCGHTWSEWRPLSQDRVAGGVGLYRIRGRGGGLAYVGEGAIRARLAAHLRKTVDPHSAKPQDLVLREQRPLECSTVVGSWQTHQRRELETDLIAAHILSTGAVPAAQFIG